MKVVVVFFLLAMVAAALAGYEKGYGGHYEPGLKHVHNGVASNYQNAVRQLAVNSVAEHYGAGTGTARWQGVPGTGGYFGYGGYGYGGHGYGGHGYGGHGYGGY